ncbi:MAG: hypothetical protein HY245_02090 [Rhizobiales bacterium]|nr:hypothetical protein [Hyphomicrobiales bacterium]MBI3672219.1 hypothetical protein [Hyphomicrobiales bacterium]
MSFEDRPADPGAAIPVIYVASHGRSGSTLLGSVLGLARGHVYVGEIRDVWRDGLGQNEVCGCGEKFRDCPFWAEVFARAFGGFDTEEVRAAAAHINRVAAAAEAPRLLCLAWSFPKRQGAPLEFAGPLAKLYRAIGDVSGATAIVDTSKTMRYGALVAGTPGLTIRLVNLIRDPRGIVASRARRARYRDGSLKPAAAGYGGGHRIVRILFKWVARNALAAHAMKRHGGLRLLYEDFVADQTWFLVEVVGETEAQRIAALLKTGTGTGLVQHQIAGNWVKDLRIEPSETWRTGLPAWPRLFVGWLSAPFRRHYRSRRYGRPVDRP